MRPHPSYTGYASVPECMGDECSLITVEDATLIADAGSTYNSCQMLPSRMLERLKVAETLLLEMSDSAKDAGDVIQFGARALYKERKDLSKMRAERDELVGALRTLVTDNYPMLCDAVHHRPHQYHKDDEPCPVVEDAKLILSKYKTE